MTNKMLREPSSKDEMDIHALIERWAKAVREESRSQVRSDHDSEMLMFDVPSPCYRMPGRPHSNLGNVLSWSEELVAYDFHDLEITAGKDVAFATAIGRCARVDSNDKTRRAVISIDHVLPQNRRSVARYA
jgi:ketosteroid isomerase-like protein